MIRLLDRIGRNRDRAVNEIREQREDLWPSNVPPLLGSGDRFALGGNERIRKVVVGDSGFVVVNIVVELLEFAGEQRAGTQAKRGQGWDRFLQHQSNGLNREPT